MFKDNTYKWPLIFAVTLHIVLFIFLFIKFAQHHTYVVARSNVNIVKAVAVDQRQVEKKLAAIKNEARRKEQAKLAHIRKIKEQKLAVEKARIAKIEAEKAEKMRKLQAQKLVQQKKVLAIKQQQIQQAMQQQMAAEQKQRAAQAQQLQGEVDKYKALILAAISQYWIAPPNLPDGISCKLLLHVAPGGEVLKIDIIQSSGNDALDRSAKTAVLKASPLPVPKEADLFDNFRLIRLTVRPEGFGD